ncbi:uncharacterized protein LOC131682978 [Topomyia yanbarensis]|uniref:uncharacterized protein LOC131682978 n=2 Tax=Topomyia yanbarensis TaxID=2498891 RepID=UPI00273C2875|nr:uncharacterized protein LOC131681589 isoform X1 [Topomyia yanbarensis]XP_058820790.1 uncharacterized protein LOC131682978 [Topomyia yanbarensis]
MDSESDVMFMGLSVLSIGILSKIRNRKNKRSRRFWVNPYLKMRLEKGRFTKDFDDMRYWTDEFTSNFHMNAEQFDELYRRIRHKLEPKRWTRADCISAKHKLAYTVEYLAGGPFFEKYGASNYRISSTESSKILRETCQAIYEELAGTEFMEFSAKNWLGVANNFRSKWNMPNCVGAIDGKHIRIKCPPNAGSLYYNYKRYHSIILLAACDADYRFTFIDVGSPGADGDMNVFGRTKFGQDILEDCGLLELPPDASVNGIEIPFFFVGDDAFPLSSRIMKPYGTGSAFSNEQKIFNYRLSRARRTIENAFGLLTMRWGCLRSEFLCYPDKVKVIVGACCALHNFLLKSSHFDHVDRIENGVFIEGEWRRLNQLDQINLPRRGRPNEIASNIRKMLTNFFAEIDVLPFQSDRAHCI